MAKVKMITKTKVETKATLMVVNLLTKQVEEIEHTVLGVFEDDNALINEVNIPNIKVVKVEKKEKIETLVGMPLVDYFAQAKEIVKEGKKEEEKHPVAETPKTVKENK